MIRAIAFITGLLAAPQLYAQHSQFIPRYDFQISLAKLSSPDPRFSWDGVVGGDIDIVDYVKGRTSLFAQYEVVMGHQLRTFDPNQSNYTFEVSSSVRAGGTEIAGVFHHLSRHLSDRANTTSISFNAVGGRVLRHVEFHGTGIDLRGDVEKGIEHEFLDYSWTAAGHFIARRPISLVAGLYARGDFETYVVDRSIAGRGNQNGGHAEAGLRLKGEKGAVEFFAGWEQVVDAYPLERGAKRWAFAGFRLVH
jgi:hypothetical protein